MLAPKRGLRVAPVPPQAADLTRPARGAGTMPGRDEGTGALIEPRNNQKRASWSCRQHHPSLTVDDPIVGETEHASHTEIRTLPAHRHPPEFQLAQQLADRPLVQRDGKLLQDAPLQIDAPPAHHAVPLQIRTLCTHFATVASCSALSRGNGPLRRGWSDRPASPCSLYRCAQSRSVWRSMAQLCAASSRDRPSNTSASASARRATLASCVFAAASRKSAAVRSSRVIATATIALILASGRLESHPAASGQITLESMVSPAGISHLKTLAANKSNFVDVYG